MRKPDTIMIEGRAWKRLCELRKAQLAVLPGEWD